MYYEYRDSPWEETSEGTIIFTSQKELDKLEEEIWGS